MELLKVCGPLLMKVIMKFSLCLYELERLVINVNDCLLPENKIPPLVETLYKGIYLFFIGGVLKDGM
jgi:hypothetical protein